MKLLPGDLMGSEILLLLLLGGMRALASSYEDRDRLFSFSCLKKKKKKKAQTTYPGLFPLQHWFQLSFLGIFLPKDPCTPEA